LIAPLESDDPPSLDRFVEVMLDVSDLFARDPDVARAGMRVLLNPEHFLDSQVQLEQSAPSDPSNRLTPFVKLQIDWLNRAQEAGVIRAIEPLQTTRLLLGMLLLEPIWMTSARVIDRSEQKRRHELEAFVRGSLKPSWD
jgi:hypothetical protein